MTSTTDTTLRCNTCGHTSCIDQFEEESCNYDGCPDCNSAELQALEAQYCSRGEHDWSNWPNGWHCIVCGETDEPAADEEIDEPKEYSDDEYMARPDCGTQADFELIK